MNLSPSTRVQLVIFSILGSAALASCGLFGKKNNDDSDNSPSNNPPTGQTADDKKDGNQTPPEGMYACGTINCKAAVEFCVTQRFTTGGKIVDNACHALPASCKDADCARAALAAPLKDLKSGSYTYSDADNPNSLQITLHFVDPDVLPLENKLADKLDALKITITSSALLSKIGDGKFFYVEDGVIKNDPTGDLHCNLLNAGSFLTLNAPYNIDKTKFRDRTMLGSRDATIYLANSTIGFECIHNQDTTPFVVADLKTIFGSLAEITAE